MARLHGKNLTSLSVGGTSLLAETQELEWADGADVHDTTTMGDQAYEYTAGLKSGKDVKHKLFYENTNTTGSYAKLSNAIGTEVALSFGDGTRTTSCQVIVKEVNSKYSVKDMTMIEATYQVTGAVTYS